MNEFKISNGGSCWLFHRWHTVKEGELTTYQECKDCLTRRALVRTGVYQPINYEWLDGRTNKL